MKRKSFFLQSYINSFIKSFFIFFLVISFVQFFCQPKSYQYAEYMKINIPLFLGLGLTVYALLTKLSSIKFAGLYEKWKTEGLQSEEDRTNLFMRLSFYPISSGLNTFAWYLIYSIFAIILYKKSSIINLDETTAAISQAMFIVCSFDTGILAIASVERVFTKDLYKLIDEGINQNIIYNKKTFGLKFIPRVILYLTTPAIVCNVISFVVLWQGYHSQVTTFSATQQINRIILVTIANVITFALETVFFYSYLKRSFNRLKFSAENLLLNRDLQTKFHSTLSDKMEYNIYLMERTYKHYSAIIEQAEQIASEILHSTENLSIISTQVSSTAMEQSSNVKEILSTMEDSNQVSKNISSKINFVSTGTVSTNNEVLEAFELLKSDLQQINAISESNSKIIDGIKNLSDQLSGITEIIEIIQDIADQTKIIAFNAELEAINTKDEGVNFHIVANEIKRVAANTTNSIQKIQENIGMIQNAAKDLIETSKENNFQIEDKISITKDLENQFNGIMNSSENTNNKAKEIADIIDQQGASFNQIVITLRQISSGIDNFGASTKTISNTVHDMKQISETLLNIQNN